MSDELTQIPAFAMAAGIRRRRFTSEEVVDAHFNRIGRLNPKLNAFVCIDEEHARQQSRIADHLAAEGASLGVLHGVPITIKSSIDVGGLKCETGTALRSGFTPSSDAPLVSRLKSAGAIVIGNTTVPECLMAWETHSALYGQTNSPWDLERTPGGSSGGEAAAIAAGCSAAGVGSDGGGSIRVPAHFSGICGLKPTPGRIPATGHFPASAGPFALLGVVGPMARSITDLELMFGVMAGPDNGDPGAAPVGVRSWSPEELKQTRIAWFDEDGVTPVTPETRAAVRRAAEVLTRDGFAVDPWRPQGLEEAQRLWHVLFVDGVSMLLRQSYNGREGDMYAVVHEVMKWSEGDPELTTERLLDTLFRRDSLRTQLLNDMDRYPVLLCPVSSGPAYRHGERQWNIGDRVAQYPSCFAYSQWFNLLGNPAVVVPIGRSPEGLPIGVQVVGRPWEEERILAIAAHLERAGGWTPPPLS